MQQISRASFFALYTLICLIWGSTWLVIHLGNSAAVPPFAASSLRFWVAGLLLWGYIGLKKLWVGLDAKTWLAALSVGILSNGISFGIVYWTANYIPSGLGAVIFGTMPLWTAVIGHYALKNDQLTKTKVLGIFIGLAGIVTIFLPQFQDVNSSNLWAMGLLLISPFVSGISTVITKRSTSAVPAVALNAITTTTGAIILGVVSILAESWSGITLGYSQLWPIFYLAILGTIVTFGIYFKLIKVTSAVTMSYVSIITPAIAVILGSIVLSEALDVYEIVGSILVLIGIAISLRM